MKREKFCELLGEINENYVKEAETITKAKKPIWVKWGAMAACLCLMVVGAFVVPTLQGEHTIVDPQPSVTPGPSIVEPGKTNLLVVNEVESVMSTDMDVQLTHYNKLPYDVWVSVLDEFYKLIGITYEEFTAKIPNIFECYNFYSLSTRGYKDTNLENEYRLHDYVFECYNENGGEAKIAICSTEEPLRDCFIVCDTPTQSEINGVSIVIYGYQGTFMVQFSYEDVNYDIETSNITIEELEDLLVGIME